MLLFPWVMHPTYPLKLIKGLMQSGDWFSTEEALDTAGELGFDEDDILDCVCNQLSETHFYKTMPAQKFKDLMQDVYHITYAGIRIYLKLQVRGEAVVVSFKEQ